MREVFLQDNFTGLGSLLLEADLSDTGAYYAAGAGEGNLQINIEKTSQGILCLPTVLPGNYRITVTLVAQSVVGYLGAVVAGAVQPDIAAKAVFDATRRMWAWANGFDALHFCVKDTAGDIRTWDGSAWATGTVAESVASYTQTDDYQLVIEMGPDHKGRFTLYDDDGVLVEQTDWIDVYGANTGENQWFVTGYPSTDEPFAGGYGFDGQQVEPCFYKLTDTMTAITINNGVTFNSGGAAITSHLDFINAVNISGGCDIQVDFALTTLNTGAGVNRRVGLILRSIDDATDYLIVSKVRTSAAEIFNFVVYINGVVVSNTNVTTTTRNKMRVVRAGTAVTAYYWSGSAWTQIATYASFVANTLYPKLKFESNAAANIFTVDNFRFTTGTVWLPNRSIKFAQVSGYEIEIAAPECRLINHIGFEEVDFPTAWGGDTVEIINAIRQELGWDFDMVNSVGCATVEADFTLINTIGGPAEVPALPDVVVLLDGAELRPGSQYTQIQIAEDIDRPPNQITIDIADEALYRVKEMYLRSDANFLTPRIEVYVDGALYDSYYWEDLKMTEDPKSTTWQIWGRNAAARLFMPFAPKITATYETTTRYALMKSIIEACGLTMGTDDYQVADFTIPGGLLVVEDEYPMDVLRQLAEADGAVVRSGRGNAIVVRYREYVIENDSGNAESYPGHNYVLTSGGSYIELS